MSKDWGNYKHNQPFEKSIEFDTIINTSKIIYEKILE